MIHFKKTVRKQDFMKPQEFENWQKSRQQGKGRFILIRGLLAWGLPMFVFMTFFINKPQTEITTSFVLTHAVIWSIAGFIFGLLVWSWSEKRFEKEQIKRASS